MIKILFPPGGYGTYLARCLYNYTNLSINTSDVFFEFASSGSSHIFRENTDAKTKIWQGHLTSPDWSINNTDQLIIVLPNKEHHLDYFNNQFDKNYNQKIVKYISLLLPIDDISNKLKINWNYDQPFDSTVPRYILREFFSFWIQDCFNNSYALEKYANIPNKITINTQDIILNFENTFNAICLATNLTKTVDNKTIRKNHETFLLAQRHYGSQLKCDQWVNAIIEGNEMDSPCKTIFDEAYIQHSLRALSYEIKCNGLNNFPVLSTDLNKIIYKVLH